jgi:hypothetical protein
VHAGDHCEDIEKQLERIERQQVNAYEYLYYQEFALLRRSHVVYREVK